MCSYYFHKSIQYLLYIINRFCLYTVTNNAHTNRCIQAKEPNRAAQMYRYASKRIKTTNVQVCLKENQNNKCTGMPQRVLTRIKTTKTYIKF